MYVFNRIFIKMCGFAILFPLFWGVCGSVQGESITVNALRNTAGSGIPRGRPRALDIHNDLDMSILYHQGNRVETPGHDIERLLEDDASVEPPAPLRIGIVQEFESVTGADGQWTELTHGGWLWTMAFHARGAKGIRLRIQQWGPPSGGELVIFDAHYPEQSFGPLDRSYQPQATTLWTPTIYGDEVNLEYYLPPHKNHRDPENWITLDGLVNQYRHPLHDVSGQLQLPCHLDVTCYPGWADEASGVGLFEYVRNSQDFICSGCIVNRLGYDKTPIFQTAEHCEVGDMSSMLITWFFESQTCNGADPPAMATLPTTPGVVVLITDEDTDHQLIGLSSDVPGDVDYEGWDTASWSNGSDATGIHHPQGDYKRISIGEKVASGPVDDDPPIHSHHIFYPEDHGLTEHGSSGSPIFDSNHRVRGVLHTGDGRGEDCDRGNYAYYGRFDQAYDDRLWIYLDGTDDEVYVGPTRLTPTVIQGVFRVMRGGDLYIDSGSYNERLTIDKAMTIHSNDGASTIGK